MKTKMKWISALSLGIVGCAIIGLSSVQTPATAFADTATIGGVEVTSFAMQYGAAVRKEDDGIRYTAQLSTAEYTALEALEEDGATVSYGMIITTAKYAKKYGLTVENLFGGNRKFYYFGETQGTFTNDDDTTTPRAPMALTKESPVMGKPDGATYNDPYLLYGSLTDVIPDTTDENKKIFLQGEYVGVAYIKYEKGDTTEYALASWAKDDADKSLMANNTRSMMQVALNRISAGDTSSATLLETYVTPVTGTTYTINQYINTHNQGNLLMETTKVTSSSTPNAIAQAMQMDGYTSQDVTITKDANGGTVINCVLQPNDLIVSAKNTTETLTIPGSNVFYMKTQLNFNKATLGVYYNASGSTWTLNSTGSGGQVAVLNAGGELIEGRDGDNGKYVNASNPIRVTSPKVDGFEYAKDISVPDKGYVIVIPGGTQYTLDRRFMREHVLNEYQNTVQLTLATANEPLTSYKSHKVFGNTDVLINAGTFATVADVKAYMLSGMKLLNDNGTFDTADDISGYTLQITDVGGFTDVNATGEYTFTFTATKDGVSNFEFTRKLTVLSASNDVRMYIKERSATSGSVWQIDAFQAKNKVNLNSTDSVVNSQFTILSYSYLTEGDGSSYAGSTYESNNLEYGIALLVDKTGKITEIFDGTTGTYQGSKGYTCSQKAYEVEALTAFRAGAYEGGYLIIAPNNTANNYTVATNGSRGARTFLRDNLVLNRYIECTAMCFTYNDTYGN